MPVIQGEKEDTAAVGASLALRRPLILYEPGDYLLQGWSAGGESGYVAAKSTAKSFYGAASLQLKTDTGTPAEDDAVYTSIKMYALPSMRMGMEFRWCPTDISLIKRFNFFIWWDDGVNTGQYEVAYNAAGGVWQYFGDDDLWHTVPGSSQVLVDSQWNFFSVRVDLEAAKYVDMISNNLHVDLSDLVIKSAADNAQEYIQTGFFLVNEGAAACEVFVDEILWREW